MRHLQTNDKPRAARLAVALALSVALAVQGVPARAVSEAAPAQGSEATADSTAAAEKSEQSADQQSSLPGESASADGSSDATAITDPAANADAEAAQPDAAQAQAPAASGGKASDAEATDPAASSSDEAAAAAAATATAATSDAPALDLVMSASNGVIVELHAPRGAFPAGTAANVRSADRDALIDAARNVIEGEPVDARAVDISFVLDGREVEPAAGTSVSVSLRPLWAPDGQSFSAVHLRDDGSAEVVDANAAAGRADFTATDFSVYGIVGDVTRPDVYQRVRLTFVSNGVTLSTQAVREGDTIEAPDPTPPEQGKVLSAWRVGTTDVSPYLNRTLTSADVAALAALGSAVAGADNLSALTATADFGDGWRAYLHKAPHGSENAGLVADSVKSSAGGECDLSRASFSPEGGFKLVNWEKWDGEERTATYGASAKITLTADAHLYPVLAQGQWVRLDMGGAPSLSNVFAPLVGGIDNSWTLSYADLPTDAASAAGFRQGFTFDGWYLTRTGDEESGWSYADPITADSPTKILTTTDSTVYAKWVPSQANYSIVHWIEGPEGGPGEGTYSYYSTESRTGEVGSVIPLEAYNIPSYHIAGADDYGPGYDSNSQVVTVSADGVATKNVYHNRDRYKPTYYKDKATTPIDVGNDSKYGGYVKWGEGPDYWDAQGRVRQYLNECHNAQGNRYCVFQPNGGGVSLSDNLSWTSSFPYYPNMAKADKTNVTFTVYLWEYASSIRETFYYEVIDGDDASSGDEGEVIQVTFGGVTRTLRSNPAKTRDRQTSYASSDHQIRVEPSEEYFSTEGFSKWAWTCGNNSLAKVLEAFPTTQRNPQKAYNDNGVYRLDYYYTRNPYTLSFANIEGVDWASMGLVEPTSKSVKFDVPLAAHDPGLTESATRTIGGRTYRFAGWFLDIDAANNPEKEESQVRRIDFSSDTMQKDTVAYAAWLPVKRTVTFDTGGGSLIDPVTVDSGDRVERPADPTRSEEVGGETVDYTFAGWYRDAEFLVPWDFEVDRVTADTTLHAKWISGKTCTLTYHDADGTSTQSPNTYFSGARVNLDAPKLQTTTVDDKTVSFLGWSTSQDATTNLGDPADLVGGTITLSSDAHVYAAYGDAPALPGPQVTLKSNYPVSAGLDSVTYAGDDLHAAYDNAQVGLPALAGTGIAVPRGWRFLGWCETADGSGRVWSPSDRVGVASATELYATWEPIQITAPTVAALTYAGTALQPAPAVTDDEARALAQTTDYTLSWDNNVNATSATSKARLTITPTATGAVCAADPVSVDFDITPAPLTVTAKPKTITYGDAAANDGVSYAGLVDADRDGDAPKAGVVEGTAAYAYTTAASGAGTAYAAGSDAGTYYITPSNLTAANYDITFAAGTLTVTPKTVTLAWASDLVYNAAEQSFGGATPGGLVGSDSVTVATYTGTTSATHAGAYTATAATLGGARAANYQLPASASHEWRITQAANEATVSIEGWTYGDAAKAPTTTASFGAETATYAYYTDEACEVPATALSPEGVPTQAGDYWVRATIAETADYAGATAKAAFTISRRPLAATAKPASVTYGEAAANDGVGFEGFAPGEGESALGGLTITYAYNESADGTGAAYAPGSAAGTYQIIPSGADVAGNYAITYVAGPLTVTPRALTVSARDVTATYGDEPAGAGATFAGLAPADVADPSAADPQPKAGALLGTLGYAFGRVEGEALVPYQVGWDVGSYAVRPSGLSSPNYDITFADGALTVGRRTAELAWATPDTFAYDGSEHDYGAAALANALAGDDVRVGSYEGSLSATDAGDYPLSATSLDGSKAGNYEMPAAGTPSLSHTWSVTQAPNEWTVEPAIEGWVAGQEPSAPAGVARFGAVAFAYRAAGAGEDAWSPTPPSEAGAWEMRARVDETANWAGIESVVSFVVEPDRLAFEPNGVRVVGETAAVEGRTGDGVTVPESGYAWDKHEFVGWNTAPDGSGDAYAPGATFTLTDGDDVFFAQWFPPGELAYDANGAPLGSVDTQFGQAGDKVAVAECGFLYPAHRFTGWNTAADGTGTSFSPGDELTLAIGGDTLYAQWEPTDPGAITQQVMPGNWGGARLAASDDELAGIVGLTEEERVLVSEGQDGVVWVEVSDVTESLADAVRARLDAAVGQDVAPAAYLDVTVWVRVGSAEKRQVSELSSPVSVALDLPDGFAAGPYVVARDHAGSASLVEHELAGTTMTFSSDRFSTYEIAASKAAAPAPAPAPDRPKTPVDVVRLAATGDPGALSLVAMALAAGVALLALGAAARRSRRARRD